MHACTYKIKSLLASGRAVPPKPDAIPGG